MVRPREEAMISFKGAHFMKNIILTCMRWYPAYPLSYRDWMVFPRIQPRILSGLRGNSVT